MDVQCDADINNTKTLIRFYSDIQNVHLIRDGPFNLQGGGEGGVCFFSKKNILIPYVVEKNILILVEEKKKI
jgi:hypothetical protein